jgi:ABC-2 type transport system ATP-binding protein
MKAIEIKNLKKSFGKIKAVDEASLDVKRGEIFGFLGPNGAGKTTTIRCLMDFITPDQGTIKILDLDIRKNSIEARDKIGYLASGPRLYDNWTGWDHINLIKRIRGYSERETELIKDLEYNPELKVATLSTGNKQKLALILALITDPDILIMDEPTLGLDPILQNKIYEILEDLKDEGKTIFMSSHNLHEVEKVCDRTGIIKKGKIVAVEDIDQIKTKHLYTVRVDFRKGFKKERLTKLKNVQIEKEHDHRLILQVKGDVNPLINEISKQKIKDIEIEHADLEQIFLEFYK